MIKRIYSSTFVPIIYTQDYDDYAAEFLRRYGFAEAITTPMQVPIWEIAQKKMGLSIYTARLSENGEDISGLIALDDGLVDIYDDTIDAYIGVQAKKGTMFLESFCTSVGRQHNSVAHECVHWWLHRLYFVNKSGGGDAVAFRCPRRMDNPSENDITDKERMELQARGICGRILMPKVATKTRVTELLTEQGLTAETATAEQFKSLAEALANTFQVSREAALVRLSQLGYIKYTAQTNQGQQRENLSGNQRIAQEKRTMVGLRMQRIDVQEFFQEFCRNEDLRDILSKGQFRFIDGYFVINNPKYITHTADARQVPILTQYAREHLDECALGFIYRRQNKGTPQSLSEILFRRQSESDYTAEAAYINDNANSAVLSKAKRVVKQSTEFARKYAEFQTVARTYTVGEAIEAILRLRDIQVQEASWQTGIATSQVTRIKSDTHKHTLRLLTQFCAGLGLEPYISRDLIEKARISLTHPTQEEFAYIFIIDTMSGNGIDEINAYLESVGIEPFNIAKENR